MKRVFSGFLLSFLSLWTWNSFADVSDFFLSVRDNPNALYAFLKEMPKGGELHYHLAGGAYGETMLNLAQSNKNYCINLSSHSVYKDVRKCRDMRAYDLKHKPSLYQRILKAWSMQDFVAENTRSGHDHFFASFDKFLAIVTDYRAQLLAEVVQRAADQNEYYMEIMDIPDDAKSLSFAPMHFKLQNMEEHRNRLLNNPLFKRNVQRTVDKATKAIRQSRQLLGCAQEPEKQSCQIIVKQQYYVLREQPLNAVFAQALNAFEAVSNSDDIVGVNLVQPEDGIISLRDYRKQMRVFEFMHRKYPKVHIALHAGEITRDYVVPEHLRFHIREAIEVGKAERIGHGVDIGWENNAEELLRLMAERNIAVEINLESNRQILGVSGKQHPINYYLQRQVPVVLSTDDEGILRTDLTAQYVAAVNEHHLDYATLRQINRNALTYSFLPGESLWQDAAKAQRVAACTDLQSSACNNFIRHNEKARIQRNLELALQRFENTFADYKKVSVLSTENSSHMRHPT